MRAVLPNCSGMKIECRASFGRAAAGGRVMTDHGGQASRGEERAEGRENPYSGCGGLGFGWDGAYGVAREREREAKTIPTFHLNVASKFQ